MFEAYPVELRPVLTRHRLRRRRHRSAASVLTGAALALGITATRPGPASVAVQKPSALQAAAMKPATPHGARAAPAVRLTVPLPLPSQA